MGGPGRFRVVMHPGYAVRGCATTCKVSVAREVCGKRTC
jgi:hypothetical protein